MKKVVWTGRLRAAIALGLALTATSCGDLQRQGTGSSYLVVTTLEAASGAEPDEFGGTLRSDVLTIVEDADQNRIPTTFNDVGRVRLRLAMKDPGGTASPTQPTSANFITIDRYTVRYIRTDGRNVPGVDVPYAIDAAATGTVTGGELEMGFTIVRHSSKNEAPLQTLAFSGVIISTIAEVTFYGHDQTGRQASVTGRIAIDFGNFGDPD